MATEEAPKLTPEEKKALQAAKKEAKKQQLIEDAKQVKRDYLGREIKYGELTIKRHEQAWRKMLEEMALPKMKEDLELAWHNFERVVDCKNFAISLLMDAVRKAEEQKMTGLRTQLDHFNKLIGLLHERLEELQEDYNNEISKLKLQDEEIVKALQLSAEDEEAYYKTMVFMLEKSKKVQERQARSDYFTKFDEARTKDELRENPLRFILEGKLKDMMNQALCFTHEFQNENKERQEEQDKIKAQDEELQVLLTDQLEKIRKACDYVNILKVKLSDSQKLLTRTVNEVKDRNDFFDDVFSTLKIRLRIDTQKDERKIKCLTVTCNKNLNYLGDLKSKVESSLRMSAVCRRLETEKEKVKPFPVTNTFIFDSKQSMHSRQEEEETIPELEVFWQRVGQADASRFALNEEKQYLKAENEKLIRLIHEYNCKCVTCPVPKMNLVLRGVKHITEGAIEQKKYEKQNVLQFDTSVNFDIDE